MVWCRESFDSTNGCSFVTAETCYVWEDWEPIKWKASCKTNGNLLFRCEAIRYVSTVKAKHNKIIHHRMYHILRQLMLVCIEPDVTGLKINCPLEFKDFSALLVDCNCERNINRTIRTLLPYAHECKSAVNLMISKLTVWLWCLCTCDASLNTDSNHRKCTKLTSLITTSSQG